MKKFIKWRAVDYAQATAQGWGLFNYNPIKINNPELRLEKRDEDEIFESDEAAIWFVLKQADTGSELHRRALKIIEQQNKKEFKIIQRIYAEKAT